ncbi:MAG: siderophore ABC transporter substrate-binding protein [Burkholderiaceae bacterium]|nr:siderophore ABC transporter substrate-binding protein [Burkholderiaceae bacterium]
MQSKAFRPITRQAQAVLAAALVSVTSLAWAQSLTTKITHVAGITEVAIEPKKTIIIDPAVLDVAHALGIPVAGVPQARFPEHMAQYKQDTYAKVGTLFEPNIDAINAIAPDLIILGRRSAPKYPELAKVAPTLDLTFNQQDLINSIAQNTRTLASIYNKQEKAEALLSTLESSVEKLHALTSKAGKGLLVFTTNEKLMAAGPNSRYGVLYKEFGVQAAIKDFPVDGKNLPLTAELIAQTNPDWIYVIDRDAAIAKVGTSAQQLLANAQVGATTAGKKNQIVYLDPTNWYMLDGAGLASVQANVEQLLLALSNQN